MLHANELISVFKVVKNLENDIKKAKSDQEHSKKVETDRGNERRFRFLRQLYAENDNVQVDSKRKRDLKLRNSIDAAIKEDCQSAGYSISDSDRSQDETTKLEKISKVFRREYAIPTKSNLKKKSI